MTNFLLKSDIDEICERVANLAETFSGKKILLTGARGFLGRYFVEIFAHLNQTILDKPAYLQNARCESHPIFWPMHQIRAP